MRDTDPADDAPAPDPKRLKKEGKGEGKGDKRGEAGKGTRQRADRTPEAMFRFAKERGLIKDGASSDGKPFCTSYNQGSCKAGKGGKGREGCRNKHECMVCGSRHPAIFCPQVREAFKGSIARS